MSVITKVPEPNLWNTICREFEMKNRMCEEDASSAHTDYEEYDPKIHNPVFYGKMHARILTDENILEDVDVSKSHPSCVGYAFTEKPPDSPTPPPSPPPAKEACTPTEYLEHYIFPTLLPAMEEMLREAKKEKCFERKRTKFSALDFLSEYLYKNNRAHTGRENMQLNDIPFVQEWLKDHPRPPLPLSLIWTEEEATQMIQSHWKGYQIRKIPEIQELRQWQKEWKEENHGIKDRVTEFWDKKMPEGDDRGPETSNDIQPSSQDDNKSINEEEQPTPTQPPQLRVSPRQIVQIAQGIMCEELVKSFGVMYRFNVHGEEGGVFFLDLKNGHGQAGEGVPPNGEPDVTFSLSEVDMQDIFTGKLSSTKAAMSGLLKIDGNIQTAMKLEDFLKQLPKI